MAKRFYTITPLTGTHIGTGEELSPLDYKVTSKIGNTDFKKMTYLKFSSDKILQRLYFDEKAMTNFERASVNRNMKELYDFFQNNCTYEDKDYTCDITDSFKQTYNENQEKDPHINAAKVLQMYRTAGTPNPVIPGSSIKGSVRTALLNGFLKGLSNRNDFKEKQREIKQDSKPGKHEKNMQGKLFSYRDAKNDPLRAVSFSDCLFEAYGTQLVGELDIVSFSKYTGCLEPIGTQIQAEVLRGELLSGKAVSELSIDINDNLQKTATPPFKTITFDNIHKSCNDFYWNEFKREYDKFYKDVNDGTEKLIIELKDKLEAAKNSKNQFIIRVGRWSQVEFVTFEDNFRKPFTRKNKFGKPLGYGGTRTLFYNDGKYAPLGWCILTLKE